MASMTITIPDAVLSRVQAALAAHYAENHMDSTLGAAQAAKADVMDYIKNTTRQFEARTAGDAARAAALNAADAQIALS